MLKYSDKQIVKTAYCLQFSLFQQALQNNDAGLCRAQNIPLPLRSKLKNTALHLSISGPGQPDRSYRFFGTSAGWTGNAGTGNDVIAFEATASSKGHLFNHLLTYCAISPDYLRIYAQLLYFRGI